MNNTGRTPIIGQPDHKPCAPVQCHEVYALMMWPINGYGATMFSSIRTVTVGSGISPDLLSLQTTQALAGFFNA